MIETEGRRGEIETERRRKVIETKKGRGEIETERRRE